MSEPRADSDRLISITSVMEITGMSRGWVYKAMKSYGFPKPLGVSGRSVRWSFNEVHAWIDKSRKLRDQSVEQKVEQPA